MYYLILFLISFLSGLSIFLWKDRQLNKINHILSFSGSFLLSICFLHLLPELFEEAKAEMGIYLMFGFFLQLILDFFSGGIEHGHTHINQKRVGHFPYLVFLSLCLHAALEAVPLEHFENEEENHALLLGLVVHKAPISFILASLLVAYRLQRYLVIAGIVIFSLSAPAGMLLGSFITQAEADLSILLAISSGIILHLSTTILLESNEEHSIRWRKLLPMILGALLAILTLI